MAVNLADDEDLGEAEGRAESARGEWSIRGHLLALVLVALFPLGVLLGQAVLLESRRALEVAQESSRALAETTAASVARFFADAEATLTGLASVEAVRSGDAAACAEVLRGVLPVLPRYANLFVADSQGEIRCSALPPLDGTFVGVTDRSWFGEALTADRFIIGAPQLGRISGRWVTVLAYPLRGNDGMPQGVVGASVDLVGFQEVLTAAQLPGGTLLTIDDLDGVVVARSQDPEAWVGRPLPTSGIDQALLRSEGGVTRAPGAEGIERVWGFAAIPGTPWRAWAGIPSDAVLAPVRAAAWRKAGWILLSILALGGVALLLYRRIASALEGLVRESAAAGAGGGRGITPVGPLEVRRVAEAFNRTLAARDAADAERRRSLDRYRSVLEHAVFGIAVVDEDGRIRETNPALAKLVGAGEAEDLRGRSFPAFFADPSEGRALGERILSGETLTSIQAHWRALPAPREIAPRELVVRLYGAPCPQGDSAMACEWMVEDVTERLVLEARVREVQKLEAVGRLSGGVAHDFNNLLTVITTTAHLMREEREADQALSEALDDILDAATRGASLTRQLLTFSRQQVVKPERLDLNRSVEAMSGLLRRLVGDGILLSTELEPRAGWVDVDPAQLQQVLLNLTVNARDASPGGAPVTIRTRRVEVGVPPLPGLPAGMNPGPYAVLEVEDRGSGIPAAIRDRIFEPFFSTKPEGRGTGLGLATVYGIATQARGAVAVQSEIGRGSTFSVYLPQQETPTSAPAAPSTLAV
jgi:PAS domain S-box-containing protein